MLHLWWKPCVLICKGGLIVAPLIELTSGLSERKSELHKCCCFLLGYTQEELECTPNIYIYIFI